MDRPVRARPAAPTPQTSTLPHPRLRVACAGVLWGTGGLTGALLARGAALSPLAIGCYRLLTGGLLLLAVLALTRRLGRIRRDAAALRRLALLGGLAAVYQSGYFAAVALTSVSLATLVTLGSAPVLVLAADAGLSRRRPSRTLLVATALALAGVGLLVGSPGGGGNPLLGAVFALCSAAGFAAITLLGRRALPGLDPASSTAGGFTLGGLVLAAVTALAVPGGLTVPVSPQTVLLIGYLGLVPTALAYVLYFGGLRAVRPGPAALIALLEPLTAAVLGAVVLGERLGPTGLFGGLLVVAAVLLCRRQ